MQINQVSVEFTVCAAAGFLSSPAPVVSPVWRLDRVRPCGSSGKHKTPTMHLCPGSLPLMWTRRRPAGWNPKNHRRHSSALSRRFPEVQTTYRHTADIKRSSLFWKHLKHSVQRQNQQNQRHKSLSVSSSLQSQRLCVVSWQYLWDRLKPLTDPTDDGQNRLRGRRFDSLQLTGPTGWTRPPGRQSTLSDGNAAGVKMWRLRLWEHFTSLIRRHGSEVGFLHRDLWAKQTLRHKDVSCQWAARPGTRESHKTDRRAEGLRKVQARRSLCFWSFINELSWWSDSSVSCFRVSALQETTRTNSTLDFFYGSIRGVIPAADRWSCRSAVLFGSVTLFCHSARCDAWSLSCRWCRRGPEYGGQLRTCQTVTVSFRPCSWSSAVHSATC